MFNDFTPDLPNTSGTSVPAVGIFRGATIVPGTVPMDAIAYGPGTPTLLSPSGAVFMMGIAEATNGKSLERFGMPAAGTWRTQNTPTPGTCTAITP